MKIFLLSPVFSKKYENLSSKTIPTRAQKRIQQEKAKNMNQNVNQEKLDESFCSKPFVKKSRGRPRKNLLTNLKNNPLKQKEREVDQENKYMKMNYQKYMRRNEIEQK